MANTKSAKKRVVTNEKRRLLNVARKSDIKTTCKKVEGLIAKKDITQAQQLLKVAVSKIARARGKGVLKQNNASHKIGRLAKKVSQAARLHQKEE